MKIFIERNPLYYQEASYTWKLIARYLGDEFTEVDEKSAAGLSVGTQDCTLSLSQIFYKNIQEKKFGHELNLNQNGLVLLDNGTVDYTSTIFYLVNCLQEYGSKSTDEIGRFDYEASVQKKHGTILENKVANCIMALCERFPQLKFRNRNRPAKIFLSHDIDSVYGSLGEDGLWALKRGRLDVMFRLVMKWVMLRPAWLDMKKILDTESAGGFRSVFFWLMNKGKINQREQNADYDFHSAAIQRQLKLVAGGGCVNGLHKSISEESLSDEMKRSGLNSRINRNHYLKFTLPDHFRNCQDAGLDYDASLGFAAHYGFRNNFSMPFVPFDIENRSAFSFIEIPLHIMDGTFQRYLRLPADGAAKSMIDFLEANNSNGIISILWHNTFFGDYKYGEYFRAYKKVLAYLFENNWQCIMPAEIREQNYWC